jgi:hypothetical protein
MKPRVIQVVVSGLGKHFGWRVPGIMARALVRRKKIFRKTHWGEEGDEEAAFVESISLAPALVKVLGETVGRDDALSIVHEVLVAVGCQEQAGHLRALEKTDLLGMARLMAFHDLMDEVGAPRFNERSYITKSDEVCHFVIRRCIFNDFFTETGVPELTRAFCEVDKVFFPAAFPDFAFHRAGSWENTIAYGEDQCEFIFEKAL